MHFCDTSKTVKAGLKNALYYMILMFANYHKTDCLVKNQDDVVAEIDKFLDVFKLYQNAVFGDANYQLKRNRETRLRHLPLMCVAELSAMGLAAVYDNGTVYTIMDSIIWCTAELLQCDHHRPQQ